MRILDKEGLKLGLPELGFFTDDQQTFERLIGLPDGILLVTGPTGSGKTTTLYSCLNFINRPDRKIITVEDPVEYLLAGINQVQVSETIGLTFSMALRSMLRQAPNVIMLGEIRDVETATIAINASLTGHLVFSTLHTNDAPGALNRLVDMHVEPYLVASSLEAVLAQRLVRMLCPHCKTEDKSEIAAALKARLGYPQSQIFYKGVGCGECRQTGFHGRQAIFEWMDMNNEIIQLLLKNSSAGEIRVAAVRNGMKSLSDDGWRLVRMGITTPEEVMRVTKDQTMFGGEKKTLVAEQPAIDVVSESEAKPAKMMAGAR
jgi:general secretion pathway protein E/type IV pilus assembly protein PilB